MVPKREHKKLTWRSILKRGIMILLGSSLVAVGLEIFLVPNHIIDGDIVGVSIILSYLSGLPSGAFLFCLNLPFFFWGYKAIGDIHDVKGGRFKKRNIH